MDEDNMLELLELYIDMVEKQDEIIHRLGGDCGQTGNGNSAIKK